MPYQCDGGDNEPVVVIITDQVEAETTAWCAGHWPLFVRTMYDAMFGAPEPAPAPAKRARKGKAADAAPEPATGDVGPVIDPDTGDDTDDDAARDEHDAYVRAQEDQDAANQQAAAS
jgi:hypothetical protein